MNTEREKVTSLLTIDAKEEFVKKNEKIYPEGLLTLVNIAVQIPGISARYKKIVDSMHPEGRELVKPQKTSLVSMASLETFSDLKIENLHNEGLLTPAVLLYRSLACEWDDCVDNDFSKNKSLNNAFKQKKDGGFSASEMWHRGEVLIKGNCNIEENNKRELINTLRHSKEEYIFYESELKNEDNFKGLDSFETLILSTEMRKRSFGGITKSITRVLTKGIEDQKLEDNMARATLAFGIIDGFIDLKEDKANGTITEAIALKAYSENRNHFPIADFVKMVSNVLSENR